MGGGTNPGSDGGVDVGVDGGGVDVGVTVGPTKAEVVSVLTGAVAAPMVVSVVGFVDRVCDCTPQPVMLATQRIDAQRDRLGRR